MGGNCSSACASYPAEFFQPFRVLKATGTSQSFFFGDVLHCQLQRLASLGFTQDLQIMSVKFTPRHSAALGHHTWCPQKIVFNVLPVRGGCGYAPVLGWLFFKKSITVSVLLLLKIRNILT